jgi:hypothetical protein
MTVLVTGANPATGGAGFEEDASSGTVLSIQNDYQFSGNTFPVTGDYGLVTEFNADVTPVYMLGDVNLDNHVNASDITSMMTALTNINSYETLKGLSDSELSHIGDVNQDGKFSNADLQALLDYLKAGHGSTNSVPEPSTFVLAVLALGILGVRRRASADRHRLA